MRPVREHPRQSAKEFATWTQASLFTVGSSLRSAGTSILSGLKSGYEQLTLDHSEKERVVFVKLGRLEFRQADGADSDCPVLLLGYEVGFQVWSLKHAVREVASRRDGAVRCMEPVPLPLEQDRSSCAFLRSWPLLAIVSDVRHGPQTGQEDTLAASCVRLYSLQSHTYVHRITVPGKILSAACSRRVLLVAMSAQIMAYNLATMTVSYSAITYPAPVIRQLGDGTWASPVPLALGARWLAHASNQRVDSSNGIATSQPIVAAHPRGAAATTNLDSVQHYATLAAKTSGKHIKSLGEAGYKYFSSQVENWRNGPSGSVPSSPSSASKAQPDDSEVVGTVIVRDLVSRTALVHFRAHTSPLLCLRFDASGTLLVTASVHGHTVNVFHVTTTAEGVGSATHLFRLSRGVTPAVIQDVSWSRCGRLLCVSSSRGTTHVFQLGRLGSSNEAPLHLLAAAIPASERRHHRPVKLQPAGRARPEGILNGNLPGSAAAAAAVNLYNGTSGGGLTASLFLCRASSDDASTTSQEAETFAEDLFVASNDGLLLRHSISPQRSTLAPGLPAEQYDRKHSQAHDEANDLVVEPVEQWDVCRRQSWPEREELLADGSEVSNLSLPTPQAPWTTQAETCLPSRAVLPVWADSQFHILEMQTVGVREDPSDQQRATDAREDGMMLRVEEVPTRRVQAQSRASLAPVIIEGAETAVLRGAQRHPSQKPL